MQSANKLYILLALAVYMASVAVYGLRWVIVLRRAGVRLRLRDAVEAYLAGILVNNITPSARAGGELMRIAYAYVKTGAAPAKLLNSVVFERISEAVPVVAIAVAALVEVLLSGGRARGLIIGVALMLAAIGLGAKYWDRLLEMASGRLGFSYDPGSEAALQRLLRDRRLLTVAAALGAAVWVMDILRLYLEALAVGWRAPLGHFVTASFLYLIIGLVAVTPGGVGIVEGGLAATFIALGAEPKQALAITIIERLISYVIASVLGLVVTLIGGGGRAWTLLKSRWRRTGFTPRLGA